MSALIVMAWVSIGLVWGLLVGATGWWLLPGMLAGFWAGIGIANDRLAEQEARRARGEELCPMLRPPRR